MANWAEEQRRKRLEKTIAKKAETGKSTAYEIWLHETFYGKPKVSKPIKGKAKKEHGVSPSKAKALRQRLKDLKKMPETTYSKKKEDFTPQDTSKWYSIKSTYHKSPTLKRDTYDPTKRNIEPFEIKEEFKRPEGHETWTYEQEAEWLKKQREKKAKKKALEEAKKLEEDKKKDQKK
jgi:hypothetical protein